MSESLSEEAILLCHLEHFLSDLRNDARFPAARGLWERLCAFIDGRNEPPRPKEYKPRKYELGFEMFAGEEAAEDADDHLCVNCGARKSWHTRIVFGEDPHQRMQWRCSGITARPGVGKPLDGTTATPNYEKAFADVGITHDLDALRWRFAPGREVSASGGNATTRLAWLLRQVAYLIDDLCRRCDDATASLAKYELYIEHKASCPRFYSVDSPTHRPRCNCGLDHLRQQDT